MNFKNIFWGVMLIVVGSLFLIQELTDFDFGNYLTPVIMIVAGGLLLAKNFLNSGTSNQSNI